MASDAENWSPGRSGGPRPEDADRIAPGEAATLKLLAEELSVGKQEVETGRVRVRVETDAREETVDIPLRTQHVEVARVPIGKEVEAIPPQRQEGDTTIVPVVEEVVVIGRKLVLKEEIHLKLVQSVAQHQERVMLHRQNATVERIAKDAP